MAEQDTERQPGRMAEGAPDEEAGLASRRRRSRLRLFLPFVALAVLAVAWSVGWLFIRARAVSEMDGWMAREAAAGRTWSCPGRTVGGYPFRIEVVCPTLSLSRADLSFQLGRTLAVVQVYQPRHAILEAAGPFHLDRGPAGGTAGLGADMTWRLLQASVHADAVGVERVSIVVEEPGGTVTGPALAEPVGFAARHLELHGRPNPGRFESDGAVDLSLRLTGASVPALDPALGGSDPADVALDATANRARGFGTRPIPTELERWRGEGGTLDLTLLSIAKGARRAQVKGTLALDDAHRATGQLDLRAAGLDAIVALFIGSRLGGEGGALVGAIVGGLLGGRPRNPASGAAIDQEGGGAGPALRTLPPLRLEGGRVFFGPIPIPNVMLIPLY